MNKKINLLLISLLGLILTFAYLTYHHYSLVLGLSQATLCHISQTLNCDAAALSSYSEFLGIPIAVLGLSFSIIMFLVILFIKLDWLDANPVVTHTIQFLFTISSALSIILGGVSVLKLGVVCPFCFLSYLLLIVSCVLAFKIFEFNLSKLALSELFQQKGFLIALAFVPFLAWFASSSIQSSYGYDELKKIIPEKIAQWKLMPVQNFNLQLGLKKGDLKSLNSLVEFADFKCSHCKSAAETIKNFEKSKPQIQIIFKPFPLDGQCNPHVSFKGDGSRCQMAGLVLCADKISQSGWIVHDYFFDNQENLFKVVDVKPVFKDFAVKNNLNADEIVKCSDSTETYDLIRSMADEAKSALVEGTPALFMNQKKLGHGQFLQVLKEAYGTLK